MQTNCEKCGKELVGRQRRYCSKKCANCYESRKEYFSTDQHKKYMRSGIPTRSRKKYLEQYKLTPSSRFSVYRAGAKVRGYAFDLTFDEFCSFWQNPCVYCGDDIETIGLDRINNNGGYEFENVIPCCTTCNKMKMTMSINDFLGQVKKITDNQGNL